MSRQTFIFLHGFGGFSDIWQWQLSSFLQEARCVSIDLPGHGKAPWEGQTLSDMADELCHTLGMDDVKVPVIIASSFGGLVALKAFEKCPTVAGRFIFVGSLPRFTSDAHYPAGLDTKKIRKLAHQFTDDTGTVLDMFFRSLFTRTERASAQYPLIKQLRAQSPLPSKEALLTFLDILEAEDLRAILHRVHVPVHFIFGDSDLLCPLNVIGSLKEICPLASVDLIKDSGHFPFLSCPNEFNHLVKKYTGL